MIVDPYESGVLDEAEHNQLVANLDLILSRAGIAGHREAVWTALSEVCGEREVEWVTNLWDHAPAGRFGLVYDMEKIPNALARMVALTGCLVRNFVSARLVTLSQAVQEQKDEEHLDSEVLLIPNFFAPADARDTPAWRRTLIHELVFNRMMAGQQTVVGISDSGFLAEHYGKQTAGIIKSNFVGVSS